MDEWMIEVKKKHCHCIRHPVNINLCKLFISQCNLSNGLTQFCALSSFFQNKPPPAIQVFNVVTQETFSVIEPTPLLSTTVARLKTIISLHVGLPVSTFRLSTALGVELYDCNLLSDYDIELGRLTCHHLSPHLMNV